MRWWPERRGRSIVAAVDVDANPAATVPLLPDAGLLCLSGFCVAVSGKRGDSSTQNLLHPLTYPHTESTGHRQYRLHHRPLYERWDSAGWCGFVRGAGNWHLARLKCVFINIAQLHAYCYRNRTCGSPSLQSDCPGFRVQNRSLTDHIVG